MMQLLHGDCLEVMRDLEANSVDTIITDPPYALTNRTMNSARCQGCGWMGTGDKRFYSGDCPKCGERVSGGEVAYRGAGFMGKAWDTGAVAFSPEVWLEALRVAKPGAFLLAFGGSRTYHRLTCAIEDAGWEIRDCIMWIYASGFPKSLDIGKAIDAKAGRIGESVLAIKREIRRRYNDKGLTLAEFNEACGFEASGYLRESSTWATVLPSAEKWQVIKSVIDCGDELDSLFAEAEREVIGQSQWSHQVGIPLPNVYTGKRQTLDITAPATDLARQWDGWGSALKPAFEPIVVAMKPLDGTFAANAEKHGVAGLWIDGGRIGTEDSTVRNNKAPRFDGRSYNNGNVYEPGEYQSGSTSGRWPANVIFDEASGALLDQMSGVSGGGSATWQVRKRKGFKISGSEDNVQAANAPDNYGDTGGASRFFLSIATPQYCLLCEQELRQKEEGSCESANTVAPITSPGTPDSDSARAVAQAQPQPPSEASNPNKRTPALSVVSSGRTTPATGESTAPESAPALPVKQLARHVKSAAHLCDTCTTLTVLALVAIKTSDSSRAASLLGAGSITEHTRQILIPNLVAFAEMWGDIDTIPTIASLKMLFGSVRDAMQHSTPTDATGTEYARIKYTPKASRSERNAGLEGMPEREITRYSSQGQGPLPQQTPRKPVAQTNHHPTVKPLALMEYLCKLTRTPTGGVVLDPFMGSGSTGVACVMTDRDFIGIEQDAEYLEIARARIEAEQAKPKQLGLAI